MWAPCSISKYCQEIPHALTKASYQITRGCVSSLFESVAPSPLSPLLFLSPSCHQDERAPERWQTSDNDRDFRAWQTSTPRSHWSVLQKNFTSDIRFRVAVNTAFASVLDRHSTERWRKWKPLGPQRSPLVAWEFAIVKLDRPRSLRKSLR